MTQGTALPRGSGGPAASAPALGIDVGATLAKLAEREAGAQAAFRLVAADATEELVRVVEASGCERVGLTGGGAAELAVRLKTQSAAVNEFEAWGRGARALLRRDGHAVPERYLLVSLGTGCSAMLVEADAVVRVGGTALGGGTVLGLGRALIGTREFAEIAALALEGDRRRVDLLVSDIYRVGELPLPGEINAASFAKLARDGAAESARPEDLAHAVMGLVGENVGLIVGGLARASGVREVIYGGATLRDNPALIEILQLVTAAAGGAALFPRDAEYSGALGAMLLGSCATANEAP